MRLHRNERRVRHEPHGYAGRPLPTLPGSAWWDSLVGEVKAARVAWGEV
jgi:hypothetical protein